MKLFELKKDFGQNKNKLNLDEQIRMMQNCNRKKIKIDG